MAHNATFVSTIAVSIVVVHSPKMLLGMAGTGITFPLTFHSVFTSV